MVAPLEPLNRVCVSSFFVSYLIVGFVWSVGLSCVGFSCCCSSRNLVVRDFVHFCTYISSVCGEFVVFLAGVVWRLCVCLYLYILI